MKRILGIGLAMLLLAVTVGGLVLAWNNVAPQLVAAQAQFTPTPAAAAASSAEQARAQKESSQISAILSNFSAKYPGQIAAVAADLDDDATASVNQNEQMVSASLYKIYVAWGIYKKMDAGTLRGADAVASLNESVDDCMQAMITVSDNDCGYALGSIDGWKTLDNQLAALGFAHTMLNNYDAQGNLNGDKLTTAGDVAGFLTQLYQGKLLSQHSTTAFIELLKQDKLNDWLPSGLPDGVVIAHKTGALYNLVHDAGIVYTTHGTYLVVVMTQGWDDPVNDPPVAFADISSQLYRYFTS